MADHVPALELDRSIGFDGFVREGLVVHPNGRAILYPLGSTVCIRELDSPEQDFLTAQSNQDVSCLAISSSGDIVASGHQTHMGFKADICVWDYHARALKYRLVLHKVKVIDLAFSPSESYLLSLGGEDDNSIVVWDLESGKAICGSPASQASSGNALCVNFLNNRDDVFVSGGQYSLRVWELDMSIRKILPSECDVGKAKRIVTCIGVEEYDDGMYCGTSTGDVLYVDLRTKLYRRSGPKKMIQRGVSAIRVPPGSPEIYIGGGDGTLAALDRNTLQLTRAVKLAGCITSITMDADNGTFFVGTAEANIYAVNYRTLEAELRATAHPTKIYDVCFPYDYSGVFATSGPNDIRLWNANTSEELLQIRVNNLNCHCICFTKDGGCVVSGWNDGKIRAFGPETGKLLYVVNDAHQGEEGVTAITTTMDGSRLVSGGADGQVRVWRLLQKSQVMEAAMKEHKGVVSSVQMRANDLECITSSADGSCIVWDLQKFIRIQVMFAPSFFKSVKFHPDENQVLSCGTDRKICFWDAFDGAAIRELEMPPECPINSLDIAADGEWFVSGGNDKLVQLWHYDDGEVMFCGKGHSANIAKVVISPDQQEIITVSEEGAIFIWKVPAM